MRLGRQVGSIGMQFLLNRLHGNDGILRTEVGDVHEMKQEPASLDVPQKLVAQTVTLVAPLIRPGMSATTQVLKSSSETVPRLGVRVVKG